LEYAAEAEAMLRGAQELAEQEQGLPELSSGRRLARTPPPGGRRHDFPGEGAPGRDYDQLPVRGADRERTGVRLLKDAEHVGHRLAVTRCGPTPADHDPLADVGRCEPDL
jgi:hypothetical protein